jgi:transcriptional regulator with XRE-family HTH domain
MEDNFNKHLGNKLKLRRLALGLTQLKLQKLLMYHFNKFKNMKKELTE